LRFAKSEQQINGFDPLPNLETKLPQNLKKPVKNTVKFGLNSSHAATHTKSEM
jgi:hypothetical protein